MTRKEAALANRIRARRLEWAKANNVSAFRVFWDKTLHILVNRRPTTLAELRAVPGLGPNKIEQFGTALLEMLRADEQTEHIE